MMRRFTLNVMVILGLIFFISNSVKIFVTAGQLAVLNDNIRLYEEQPIKTNEMTAQAERDSEIRENNFYHSQDRCIRYFSNLYGFFKVLVLAIDVVFGIHAVKESFLFTENTIYRLIHRRHKGYYRK